MKPSFYISSLGIENFRGIHTLAVEFDPDAPTVLIGPNNAGKSTVLDALGLALGTPRFSKFVPSADDFWSPAGSEPTVEFIITVRFAVRTGGCLAAVKGGVGDPIDVHGIRCTGSEDGLQRLLIDSGGKEIVLNAGAPISKAKQGVYQGQGLNARRYARVQDIQKWMPLTWQLDSKTLIPSLYDWKSGPLQQLLSQYRDDLLTAEWQTAGGRAMPESLRKAYEFVVSQALPSPFWRDKLSANLIEKFQSYLGRRSDLTMSPALNSVEDWLASELRLNVSTGPGSAEVESRRMGDGWQSILRLAALETVADLGIEERAATVILEEPETYLHPHLRRRLRRSLHHLQARGYQVIAATHAPELISLREKQKIVRLQMTTDGAVASEYATDSVADALRQQEKLEEHGNHEVVFASVAILTEGKGDAYAVQLGLEKLGLDRDAESVSVLACGSVGNIPDYATLCHALGIPWIAIHDTDLDPSTDMRKPNTAKAREKLDVLQSDEDLILEWDNDLEAVLGCAAGKVKPAWIDEELGSKDWATIKVDPSLAKYSTVVEAIRQHLIT